MLVNIICVNYIHLESNTEILFIFLRPGYGSVTDNQS